VRRALPLLVALGLVAAVLLPYLALGGASFEPTPVADPCATREWRDPGGVEEALEQVALSALDSAACELGVAREDIVLAVRDEESLDQFSRERGISRAEAERALEHGLDRAVEEAEDAGSLSGVAASLVASAIESLPPWLVLDALARLRDFLS
jgi:hypothetical protein